MKRVIICLADGFEEIEALVPADLMKRAGMNVVIAGVTGLTVTGGHGISVNTDGEFDQLIDEQPFDCIMLPGGQPGANNLAASWKVNETVVRMLNENSYVAAICAAPAAVLGRAGLLEGRKATGYPGSESLAPNVKLQSEAVVTDGNLITAQGPGKASEFAFTIIAALEGEAVAEKVRSASLF